MLNPQTFNSDYNFSKGQIDIKELNAFMNDKKRKIEKELTKYDVDKDTQAKALNVQHLAQMPKYLPLFTKKIKDPKAMKKQKATRDVDYTKHNYGPDQSMGGESSDQIKNDHQEIQQQHFVIEEQFPLQEEQDEYRQEPIEVFDHPILTKPITEKAKSKSKKPKKRSDSPNGQVKSPKQDLRSPNKHDDAVLRMGLIERENYSLKEQVEAKRQEYEQINYKYAKAQSQFIEIMRELSRFRDEFNDQYSIRSKLKKVKQVTLSIDQLLNVKTQILKSEEQQLTKFQSQEEKLFESDSPMSKKSMQTKRRSSVAMREQSLKDSVQSLTSKHCKIGKDSKNKILKINNVRCIVNYTINKQKAECTVYFYPQVHHEVFSYTFTKITEKFKPWKEIEHFTFRTVLGELKLELVDKVEQKYLDNDEDNMYYKVNKNLIKYIHQSPLRLNTISLNLLPGNQSISLSINEPEFNKNYCTVDVTEEKILKDLVPIHLSNFTYEEHLEGLLDKHTIIETMISKYVKKYLQMGDHDVNPLTPSSALFGKKSSLGQQSMGGSRFSRLAIFDREIRGLKGRRRTFMGIRVPNATLGNYGGQTMNPSALKETHSGRRTSSVNNTMKNSAYFFSSFEKMKDAVIAHIQKKKDQEKSNLNTHLAKPQLGNQIAQSTLGNVAMKIARRSVINTAAQDNKMGHIMKLIYANSMYVTIHFELYVFEKDDFPVYIELVHNTDDDSLILFIVSDPKELTVKEVKLDELHNNNWTMLKERFGSSSEQLNSNIETIFRTLEFLNIIRSIQMISPSRGATLLRELTIPYNNSAMSGKRKATNTAGEGSSPREIMISQEMNIGNMKIKIN